ncbi:hypothetical protein AB4099_32490 [Bosea sp. 2KB_26]|uniref:hypothetical protein n=1 Tax=Bosea sp. 2KB_26 TaxID=3237475 RepID=UPI003F934AF6
MLKSTLALASLGFVLALSAAHAQTPSCSQAELTKMETDAGKMTDATKRAATMKEVSMAKEMMAKNDTKACMTHMNNAMKMMPKS